MSRYTKADLLDAAQAHGTPATGRLITDWVSLGLLDKPVPRSRGRGKGVERTWSENQLQLFVVLLDKRREVRRRRSLQRSRDAVAVLGNGLRACAPGA